MNVYLRKSAEWLFKIFHIFEFFSAPSQFFCLIFQEMDIFLQNLTMCCFLHLILLFWNQTFTLIIKIGLLMVKLSNKIDVLYLSLCQVKCFCQKKSFMSNNILLFVKFSFHPLQLFSCKYCSCSFIANTTAAITATQIIFGTLRKKRKYIYYTQKNFIFNHTHTWDLILFCKLNWLLTLECEEVIDSDKSDKFWVWPLKKSESRGGFLVMEKPGEKKSTKIKLFHLTLLDFVGMSLLKFFSLAHYQFFLP